VVVNFPHNPTGALPTQRDLDAVVDIANAAGATLFSDEMYRGLELDENPTLASACELDPVAITLSGLSKSYGLPGLRIGWLVTRDRERLTAIAGLRDYTTICNSAPSEVLALMALRASDRIVGANNRRVQTNVELLADFFASHEQVFSWIRPKAGTTCFPRLLGERTAVALCDRARERMGILLVPSTLFEFGDAHVRIGLGRDDLPEVLERFAACLE